MIYEEDSIEFLMKRQNRRKAMTQSHGPNGFKSNGRRVAKVDSTPFVSATWQMKRKVHLFMSQVKNYAVMMVACVCVVASPLTASAAGLSSSNPSTNVTVGISPGGLNITPPSLDHSFYVTSDTQTSAYADLSPMVVTDATGTGAGWNVTVQASQVSVVSETLSGRFRLPYGSLQLMAPSVSTDNPMAVNAGPTTVQEDLFIDMPNSTTTVVRATPNNGMGKWVVNFPKDCLRLNLGSVAHDILHQFNGPVSFSTTLTWRVSCGP